MNARLQQYQARCQRALDAALGGQQVSPRLQEAMRYSTLNGGKRLRALLVYAAGEAVSTPAEKLDSVAAALECMHAYSLIHDDLPCMDDDALRRGQATNHIQFDEATAVLAGDALQALAAELINSPDSGLSDQQCRIITHKLTRAAGHAGMVGGQMLDIQATGKQLDRAALENIHRCKTGALISAAVECGGLCADNPTAQQLAALSAYAENIGLAFQVVDDILDIESSTETLGKTSGADLAAGKLTYPALLGLQASRELAQTLYQQAVESIAAIGDNNGLLLDIAALVVNRKH